MTDYTLIRSKRKTVALHIRDGSVEVRAPLNMPKRSIDQFVLSKEKWVTDKLAKSSERAEKRGSFALAYDSHVAYRGKQYPITGRPGNRIGFDESGFYMPPGLAPEQIKHACVQIYRALAKRVMTEKASAFAAVLSVSPSAVKINGAKTRWGSCSAKKSLNFSWMLVMADDDLIDYVVVHELAHIIELNHSERFWALVRGVLPDCDKRKRRLKELQHKLAEESW
jgi:hypothetical protein